MEKRVESLFEENGGMCAFQKLPEEVVENILGHLEGKDLASCSRTCRLFNRILEPTKHVWMLDEVLPLIAKPELLGRKDVLNLRKVCHEWRRAVDDWLEEGEMKIVSYGRSYKCAEKTHEMKRNLVEYGFVPDLDLVTRDKLWTFKEQIEGKTGNPFCGRRLSLGPWSRVRVDLEELYWVDVDTFLKEFGVQVTNCRLFMKFPKYSYCLRSFRKLWRHLPNIRKLAFLDSDDIGWICTDKLNRIEETYENKSLPALHHLKSLTVTNMPEDFCTFVFPAICSQLHHLEVRENNVWEVFRNPPNPKLPNLTSLSFTCGKSDLHWLNSLSCPVLTHLVVRYRYRLDKEDNLRGLLEAIAHFGSTLRELDIKVIGGTKPSSCRHLNLDFPHLQILKLKQWSDSHNWLLRMPSLQLLVIEWEDSSPMKELQVNVQEGDTVEIHGFMSRLYESNIWPLLPSLMEVRIKHGAYDYVPIGNDVNEFMAVKNVLNHKYTREWYERHVKTSDAERVN